VSEGLELYVKVLRERVEVLAQNLRRVGSVSIPERARPESGDPRPEARWLLERLAELDELKRSAWLGRARTLPIDGEILNREFYREQHSQLKSKDDFNFYWRRPS
jgi:hypothetical protein